MSSLLDFRGSHVRGWARARSGNPARSLDVGDRCASAGGGRWAQGARVNRGVRGCAEDIAGGSSALAPGTAGPPSLHAFLLSESDRRNLYLSNVPETQLFSPMPRRRQPENDPRLHPTGRRFRAASRRGAAAVAADATPRSLLLRVDLHTSRRRNLKRHARGDDPRIPLGQLHRLHLGQHGHRLRHVRIPEELIAAAGRAGPRPGSIWCGTCVSAKTFPSRSTSRKATGKQGWVPPEVLERRTDRSALHRLSLLGQNQLEPAGGSRAALRRRPDLARFHVLLAPPPRQDGAAERSSAIVGR
jgi:hypothetical protein